MIFDVPGTIGVDPRHLATMLRAVSCAGRSIAPLAQRAVCIIDAPRRAPGHVAHPCSGLRIEIGAVVLDRDLTTWVPGSRDAHPGLDRAVTTCVDTWLRCASELYDLRPWDSLLLVVSTTADDGSRMGHVPAFGMRAMAARDFPTDHHATWQAWREWLGHGRLALARTDMMLRVAHG